MIASSRHTLPALLLIYLCCTSCSRTPYPVAQRSLLQFGTLIDVTLYDVEPSLANAALDQLEQNFSHYHASWTPWQESALQRTNQQLKAGQSFSPSAEILALLTPSITLAEQSRDLFNPAIGKLIRLWQFHKHDEIGAHPPEPQKVAALVKQNPSLSDLQLDNHTLSNNNPTVELNFGAYAKGYAIDLSMNYLRQQGIQNAVINAGGDLSVSGQAGDRAWRIGIRHPRENGVIASLQAHDGESIFTSGDYERFYIYEGQRYHHILDPRTGHPAATTSSVTVIHTNAGIADAAATALFIAGPSEWYDIARRMGIKYVMLIDINGSIHINPAMLERIEFSQPTDHNIVLSEAL